MLSSYREQHLDRVPVDPMALNPKRGGPKNLKIAEALVDDGDERCKESSTGKQRLVIVGGGWGAVEIGRASCRERVS